VEDKHREHLMSEVAAIVKLEARNQLKNLNQRAFESIITNKKRYNGALKAYHDHGNPPKDRAEQWRRKRLQRGKTRTAKINNKEN
jgi:hypothetical protein